MKGWAEMMMENWIDSTAKRYYMMAAFSFHHLMVTKDLWWKIYGLQLMYILLMTSKVIQKVMEST
jgi:hypothetical protein